MKLQERRLAKELFLKGKNQKEVAALVGVGEKTVGKWVANGGWKAERNARINSDTGRIESLKCIIGNLSEERLKIMHQLEKEKNTKKIMELNQRGLHIAGEVANYNKTLENLQDQKRVSLAVYIDVMEQIFNALQLHSPELYLKLVDFQQDHLSEVAIKYQ